MLGPTPASKVFPVTVSPPAQRIEAREETWMAEIEPLSVLIHAFDNSCIASLIDRRMRCTVELVVESDLESAKRAALSYAEQYMHVHLGELSWALPQTAQWYEFVAIRSSEDLRRRVCTIMGQSSPTTVSCLPAPVKSRSESASTTTRRFVRRSEASLSTLFLSLPCSRALCGPERSFFETEN